MADSTIRHIGAVPRLSQQQHRRTLTNLHREVVQALATEQMPQHKWDALVELRDRIRSRLELLDALNEMAVAPTLARQAKCA